MNHNESIKRLRNMDIRDVSFGRWIGNIRPEELPGIYKRFPELNCGDVDIEGKAWKKFFNGSASEKWRIRKP